MPAPPDGTIYSFGDFELDTRLRELRHAGDRRHIEPQVFDVLCYLFAHRDRLVTRNELLDQVWGHRYVAPATLSSRIKAARQAVSDDGQAQRVIRTIHGHGFRVVAEVEERVATEGPATNSLTTLAKWSAPTGSTGGHLLERGSILSELRALLIDAAAGYGHIAVIAGEAGAGKTSVVEQFAATHALDGRTLRGLCDPLATPRPFGPVHDMAKQADALAVALRATDRAALFSAFLTELESPPAPHAVVVEDIQWADDATLDLLKFIGRRIARLPVLLILTYRDDEVGPAHPLHRLLGQVPQDTIRWLRLALLSPGAVAQMAQRMGREAEGLYQITGGNPFFVTELLASADARVPASITAAILARATHLSPDARALADLVAVIPRRVERSLLDALLPNARDRIRGCLAAGLLTAGADDVGFCHEIARLAWRNTLDPHAAAELNARVIQTLRGRTGKRPDIAGALPVVGALDVNAERAGVITPAREREDRPSFGSSPSRRPNLHESSNRPSRFLQALRSTARLRGASTEEHAPRPPRTLHPMHASMNALRLSAHTWRSLRRAPVFTTTIILTLAIGIGAATTIFSVVNAVLLRPLPYANADRLVRVWHDLVKIDKKHWTTITGGMYLTYKRAHTLDRLAVYVDGAASITDPDGRAAPERATMARTTANLFHTLGVAPLLGRTYSEAEDVPRGPAVAVISEGFWRSRFAADLGIIGRRIVVDGRPREIIGVMPAHFRFPSADTRLWLPSQLDPNDPYPGFYQFGAVARLAPGVSLAAAQRDLAAVLPRMVEWYPNVTPAFTTRMLLDQQQPLPRLTPMRDDIVGDFSRTLWVIAAAAVLVLLVTCANVANLLLVRADGRYRELAVRTALGAGRSQVLAQFFAESAVLAGIAAVLAITGAGVGIKLLVRAAPAAIPRLAEIHVDAVTIAFTIIVALFVAVACSVIPAVRFLRSNALASLREGGRSGTAGGRRQRARSVLVAAQMAFALVVLAASGLLFRSFQRLHAVEPGFNPENVATLWLSLPPARYRTSASIVQFYATLTQRASNVPGVRSAGVTSHVPLVRHGSTLGGVYVEGDARYANAMPPLPLFTKADAGYFKAIGVPLIAGRTFSPAEAPQLDEAIISQSVAALFFNDSTGRLALGKRFQSIEKGPWHTIVGVVASVHDTSLSAPVTNTVYLPEAVAVDTVGMPAWDRVSRTMALVARTKTDPAMVAQALQAVVHELDPTLPTFEVQSMRATVDRSIARLSFTMVILGVAAGVTLVLGIVGLYGVIAYVVTLQTREIGVRIALGAQPNAVMVAVTKQGLVLSLAGVAAGVVLSLVAARFLRVLLFEVAPSDPITLGGASAIMVILALLASVIPARRAANVDPTESLRAD